MASKASKFLTGFPKVHSTQPKTETRKSKMSQILRRQANNKVIKKITNTVFTKD